MKAEGLYVIGVSSENTLCYQSIKYLLILDSFFFDFILGKINCKSLWRQQEGFQILHWDRRWIDMIWLLYHQTRRSCPGKWIFCTVNASHGRVWNLFQKYDLEADPIIILCEAVDGWMKPSIQGIIEIYYYKGLFSKGISCRLPLLTRVREC